MFDNKDYFETFAQKIAEYIMRKHFTPWIKSHGVIQSYRAKVVFKNETTQTMYIQRPFDNEIELPYTNGAANLAPGDYCTVFILGEPSNSVIVADGKMNIS